ncbi:hypothetical protein B6U90_00685 [Thermoplasmatales archaeon ex4484_6]|nr:MAG: hypothetical protein B6U90_00685 [Thermoplasmatales archaeon ex4484_6]RLF66694.1 MAG: hypothetical protein DRN57_06545 [Thermoplasmata archaeon]
MGRERNMNEVGDEGYLRTDTIENILMRISGSGAVRAASTLGEMLGMDVEIKVPLVQVESVEEAVSRFQDDVPSFGIYVEMEGDLRNHFLVLISEDDSKRLAALLTNEYPERLDLSKDSLAISSLKEVGNILASSFSNDLGDRWGMDSRPTPPEISFDLPRALVSFVLVQFAGNTEKTLVFHTTLNVRNERFRIDLLMAPPWEELDKLDKLPPTPVQISRGNVDV